MARYLVRILLLRAFGFVLFTAFLVAYQQWRPLLGDDGITPVNSFLDRVDPGRLKLNPGRSSKPYLGLRELLQQPGLERLPSLLWLVPRDDVDAFAEVLALMGMCFSALTFVTGTCSAFVMFAMWAFYFSLVQVGQDWYSFGWESQLCETAFLMIFACPLWWRRMPEHDLPVITTYLLRWLLFRVMLGAGLIKLRGDDCWRNLTCMQYHYHTQPVPNPASPYFHALPTGFHRLEVVVNHIIECVVPFFLALPQPGAAIGAVLQVGFQLTIVSSGNLSFLNWLTMVPAIAGLDDRYVSWLFSASTVQAAKDAAAAATKQKMGWWEKIQWAVRQVWLLALLCGIAWLSVPIVENLLSPGQVMNSSANTWRIVNNHGNFGSITRDRNELIIEGRAVNGTWLPYEFKCKPGDINRRPCLISPYHYRLDWLMWFAAFSDPNRSGWLQHLALIMLDARNNAKSREVVTSLLATVPFGEEGTPTAGPTAIRLSLYAYEYRTKGQGGRELKREPSAEVGAWWQRKRLADHHGSRYLEWTRAGLEPARRHYKPSRTKRDK